MEPKAYSYIRFSSPQQEKGDSYRRQIEQSEAYAKHHGLTLDDSLSLTDRGLSAYTGAHKHKGALGEFLKLVEQGNIAPGSMLIVENLDRLSREKVLDALTQFLDIIRAGIKLVTLQDGKEYTKESIDQNWTELIISLSIMSRAHEESKTKSNRHAAVWNNKRKKAAEGKKVTSVTPYWIELRNGKFEIVPGPAKAVREIYNKKLEGKGTPLIVRELNTDPNIWKPPKKKKHSLGGWSVSYVNKILRTRAVIGEYQPYKFTYEQQNGKTVKKKVPAGEPIQNYYPPVIDEEIYNRVQSQIKAHSKFKGYAGGNISKGNNLFTHIAYCGLCGGPLHFYRKDDKYKYLICYNGKKNKNCSFPSVKYEEVEHIILSELHELNISDILPQETSRQKELNELNSLIESNNYKISEIQRKIDNLWDTIEDTKDKETRSQLQQRIETRNNEIEQLKKTVENYKSQYTDLQKQEHNLSEHREKIKEINTLLESAENEQQRIDLRLRLREQLKKLVDSIEVYPLQEKYISQNMDTPEPGLITWMNSRYIKKIRIKFRGVEKKRVLYLKGVSEYG